MALRLKVVLRTRDENEAEAAIVFTGDDADLAAAAVAAWLSEDIVDLLDLRADGRLQRPDLN